MKDPIVTTLAIFSALCFVGELVYIGWSAFRDARNEDKG